MYYYNFYFQKCASYIGLTHLHRLNSKVCKQRFKMRKYYTSVCHHQTRNLDQVIEHLFLKSPVAKTIGLYLHEQYIYLMMSLLLCKTESKSRFQRKTTPTSLMFCSGTRLFSGLDLFIYLFIYFALNIGYIQFLL